VAEVTVILGTKLTEQERQSADMTTATWLTAQPPPGTDVEAQCSDNTYCAHICPVCGCISWATGQPQPWGHIFICHCCGSVFRG
jgi:hypothetical protein